MKYLMMIFLVIAGWVPPVFAADVNASSRVREVTVYPSGAFVTREARVELSSGDARVWFRGIVPEIDESSIRVRGKGSAQVRILGAQVKREYTEDAPVARVREIEAAIQAVEDEDARLENEKQVLAEEKQYLDSVRLFADKKIPEDLVTRMPPPQDLEGTLAFLGTKLRANFARGQEIEIALRNNEKKLESLKRELADVMGPGRRTERSVVVDIEVAKAGSLDLELSYKVSGASWESAYDARADFDRSEVEIVSYGIVRQNTGEDWQDSDLVLSTASVSAGGNMPEADSWFIRPYQPPQPVARPKMLAAAARSLGRGEEKSQDSMVSFAMEAPAAPIMDAQNLYTNPESKGISVVYRLPRKATVKTDGSDHKLPVSAQSLKAVFEYSTYPRAAATAYLRSRVANSKDLQLPAGRVSVFFDGDFMGTSHVENTAPGQEFDLYMGADDQVKVKRELLEKKADDVLLGGIPAPNKKITYKYKLTVENYKAKASTVHLFETIPVSEDERIKVKVSGLSLEPVRKDWKDRKGVWHWELQLDSKAKKEIFYTCVVEFPRDMRVEGLD